MGGLGSIDYAEAGKVITLREYQGRTNKAVRSAISNGDDPVVLAPTGAGKSIMITDLLLDDEPQIVYTHRKVLLDQLAADLTNYGVNFGYRASGKPQNPDAPIQLAMIQTDHARVVKSKDWPLFKAKRVHIDEIHANAAANVISLCNLHKKNGASIIGWSATPVEVSHICNKVIESASVQELIQLGHLVRPVTFTPDGPDVGRLAALRRQANGDYEKKGLAKIWNHEVVFGSVVKHFERLNPLGRPTVLFGPDVQGSLWYAQHLSSKGYPFGHIDSKCIWMEGEFYPADEEHRNKLFKAVASQRLLGLCNRFVLREGWNLPIIEHIIMACIFGDRVSWVQAGGRGLRSFPGKSECIIQDHGGNAWRFSALDEDEPWDIKTKRTVLEEMRKERMRQNNEIEPIVCNECDAVRAGGSECPVCGARTNTRSRMVIELDGSLRRVNGPLYLQKRVTALPGDDKIWERIYWSNKKNNPNRTFKQARAWYAQQNAWRWLPMDLPYMPVNGEDWLKPIGEVPFRDLIQ